MKYYIDTSIWRDYYEDRKDKLRPLGEFAFKLIKYIKENKDRIVYSDLIIKELSIKYNPEDIKKIFEIISEKDLLIKADYNNKQIQEAEKLAKKYSIPKGDALHTVLARDNDAILVTRDMHFNELSKIVKVKKPEEIL